MKPVFLTALWQKLIMANYEIDPAVLSPYLPAHTILDEFEGKYYVSLVGFLFDDVRLKGWRIPYHTRFPEVNLRFYVKRDLPDTPESVQRGVVFVSEIVPRFAIAWVANTFYKEQYSATQMKHHWKHTTGEWDLQYEWKQQRDWFSIKATVSDELHPMPPGSAEAFIFEHYYGYSKQTAQLTHEYEVAHPSWQHYPVKEYDIVCDFEKVYGKPFAFLNLQKPASVFVAEGSEVVIHHKRVLKG
jgi:uncharacterized protein